MSTKIGYSKAEAFHLKEKIELDAIRIEQRLLGMVRRVSDVSSTSFQCEAPETVLERIREIAYELHAVVDRRTR